jgi:hypothetical protein
MRRMRWCYGLSVLVGVPGVTRQVVWSLALSRVPLS